MDKENVQPEAPTITNVPIADGEMELTVGSLVDKVS